MPPVFLYVYSLRCEPSSSERLKGYSVALEVFGRPETFEPVADPIVRVEVGRLREKLCSYYDTDGMNDPIRIELPRGSYKPRITD